MAKVVKFAITGKGDYYLPVGPGTTVSYAANANEMLIGVQGNVILVSLSGADSAGANVIGLSKAIYDVLKDSTVDPALPFNYTCIAIPHLHNLAHRV